jgi:hypothetical protein
MFAGFNGRTEPCALERDGRHFGKDGSLALPELERTDWGTKTVDKAVPLGAEVIKALPHRQHKQSEIEMSWVCQAAGARLFRIPWLTGRSSDNRLSAPIERANVSAQDINFVSIGKLSIRGSKSHHSIAASRIAIATFSPL